MKRQLDLGIRKHDKTARFDTRPRAVRQWLEELPVADLDALAVRLWRTVADVNCLAISPARRFYFLEQAAAKARLALDHLRRRYERQPIPLPDPAERAAAMAGELLGELLRGYLTLLTQILTDKERTSRWRRFWYNKELVGALHRFVLFGGELLDAYRLVYQPAPEGLWKRIHGCYRIAESYGYLDQRLAPPGERRRDSLGFRYRRLLLLALLPANSLTKEQWQELVQDLAYWIPLLDLIPPPIEDSVPYVVRLGTDAGPLGASAVGAEGRINPYTLGLGMDRLRAALEQRLTPPPTRWFGRRQSSLQPETVHILLHSWCKEWFRTESRHERNAPVEVVFGLGALYHLLGGEPPPTPELSETEAGRGIQLVATPENIGHVIGARADAEDVWKSAYYTPTRAVSVEQPNMVHWTENVHAREVYRPLAGRLLNESAHGFGISIARSDSGMVTNGMLVGIHGEGQPWRVGLVLRISDDKESLQLGLRTLFTNPFPAGLVLRSARALSNALPALLGQTENGFVLAAPALPGVREGEPLVSCCGRSLAMQRGKKVLHSPQAEVFVVIPSDAEDKKWLAGLSSTPPAARVEKSPPPPPPEAVAPPPPEPPPTPAAPPPPPAGKTPEEARVEELMRATGMRREDAEFFIAAEMAHAEGNTPRLKQPRNN